MSDLDGDALPANLKALLQVESERPAPDVATQSRVLKRLEVSVFATAGTAAVVVTQAKVAKGALAFAKLWLVAPVVVGAVTADYFVTGREVIKPPPKAPVIVAVSLPVIAAPVAPDPEALAVDAGIALPEGVVSPTVAPRQLPGERALIETARSGLARRRFPEAEAALAEHLRRFTVGTLAEERDALSITLLTATGKTAEADQATQVFHARYPNSLLLRQAPWPGGFKK